jgi:putative transposase
MTTERLLPQGQNPRIEVSVKPSLAQQALHAEWGQRYPMITKTWTDAWEQVIPFPAFPPGRQADRLHHHSIEALHRQVRKTIKTRGHLPTEDAARKLIYLSIINAQQTWRKAYNWNTALVAFKIHFEDRLP